MWGRPDGATQWVVMATEGSDEGVVRAGEVPLLKLVEGLQAVATATLAGGGGAEGESYSCHTQSSLPTPFNNQSDSFLL